MPKPPIVGMGVGKETPISLKECSQATGQTDKCAHTHTRSPSRRGKKSASRFAATYYLECPLKTKDKPREETGKYDSSTEENQNAETVSGLETKVNPVSHAAIPSTARGLRSST
ncbi:unnamed protein product [Rangifer tarandus platyrhynchus]|uniref:Uncharacterized protein n=2 Tax=Rangifer tarandus platyrhynchus TaxID=3082113 RepID=A0AC59YCG5_RANTA|nr:unnamed protein product [Rangifer tarandus platyrhynchus]